MTYFKAGDIVVMRCTSRFIDIDDAHCHVSRFTRDVFFRLCTPDEAKEFWTDRRDIAISRMTTAKEDADNATLALYALENDK